MRSDPVCPKNPTDGWEAKEKGDSVQQLRNELAIKGSDRSQSMSWNGRHISSLDLTALGQMSTRQVDQEALSIQGT